MPTDYPAAKLIAGILSAIGWVFIVTGGLALIVAIITLNTPPTPQQAMMGGPNIFLTYLIIGVSAMSFLFGLLYVASGQMIRATTDSADYNREMLALTRRSLGPQTAPPPPSRAELAPDIPNARKYPLHCGLKRHRLPTTRSSTPARVSM